MNLSSIRAFNLRKAEQRRALAGCKVEFVAKPGSLYDVSFATVDIDVSLNPSGNGLDLHRAGMLDLEQQVNSPVWYGAVFTVRTNADPALLNTRWRVDSFRTDPTEPVVHATCTRLEDGQR